MKTYKITDSSSKKNIGKIMTIDGDSIKIGRTLFVEASNVYNNNLKETVENKKALRLWRTDNIASTGTYIFTYEEV